jgi:hypothetical protein
MNRQQMHEYARFGAQSRLAAIAAEREELLTSFPELRGGSHQDGGAAAPRHVRCGAQGRRHANEAVLGQAKVGEGGTRGGRGRQSNSAFGCCETYLQAQRHVRRGSEGCRRTDAGVLGGETRREAGRRTQTRWAERRPRPQEIVRRGWAQDARGGSGGSEYRVGDKRRAEWPCNKRYRPSKRDGQLVRTVNRVACWPSGTIKRNRCPSAVTSY